eukprot:TRINITY_DN61228_c0_g1_i1.p1 TRINITY_DN61228_c0_g1~~TRINITY_DN61228_c0_g1_i1.p1  ORF type:complete len:483 (+),score=72.27 TRINITY_DN61228_c0_g1_i1:119-1567(+)
MRARWLLFLGALVLLAALAAFKGYFVQDWRLPISTKGPRIQLSLDSEQLSGQQIPGSLALEHVASITAPPVASPQISTSPLLTSVSTSLSVADWPTDAAAEMLPVPAVEESDVSVGGVQLLPLLKEQLKEPPSCYRDTTKDPRIDGHIWTEPEIRKCEANACVFSGRSDGPQSEKWTKCKSVAAGKTFWLEDAMALGHFQMTVTNLFTYILSLKSGDTVDAVFDQASPCPCPKTPIWRVYYEPFLDILQDFALKQLNVTLRVSNVRDHMQPWCHQYFARRNCLRGHAIHGGHCGTWFDTPATVSRFRHFLTLYDMLGPPQSRSERTLKAVVFGRASTSGRHFTHPEIMVSMLEFGCKHLFNFPCAVNYTAHPTSGSDAHTLQWNCRRYSGVDLIVEIHGAALANLICARAGAGLIEVLAAPQPDGKWPLASMFTYLATQMGVHYCPAHAQGPKGFCCHNATPSSLMNCMRCLSDKLMPQGLQ